MVNALLLLAALAGAEPETAKAAYERAQGLYNQGRFEEALPLFERAYVLSEGRPASVFGLAQCHRALGHYPQALEYFQAYATLTLPEHEAERVAVTIAEIQQLLREASVTAEPEPEPEPELEPRPPPPPPPPPSLVASPPPESSGWPVGPIVAGSLGVAASVTGVVLGQTALSEARRDGANDGLVRRGEIADGLIISGAVVVAGAVVWWLLD